MLEIFGELRRKHTKNGILSPVDFEIRQQKLYLKHPKCPITQNIIPKSGYRFSDQMIDNTKDHSEKWIPVFGSNDR